MALATGSKFLQNHDKRKRPRLLHYGMNMKFILTILASFAASGLAAAGTNDLTTPLQRGLFEEEANHQLDAAIVNYKEAIEHFDHERQLAATAIFRLGECYRKLGRTNEANAQYERIVREFSDQTQLAQLSRTYLPASGGAMVVSMSGVSALPSEEEEFLRHVKETVQNSPDLVNKLLPGAVEHGYVAAAEFLLEHGADVNQGSSVVVAATHGNEAMVQLLLKHGAGVNSKDKNGNTPLFWAALNGFTTLCQTLIAHGADVNLDSPIVFAAQKGNEAIVELLLSHGAAVDGQDSNGQTALSCAAQNGFMNLCRSLFAHGADVNTKNHSDATPLHAAVEQGQIPAAEFLITNKAQINAKSVDGQTPLLVAIRRNDTNMVKLLLDNHADANTVDNAGETPLALAIARGQTEFAKLLLDNRADANVEAVAEGWTYMLSPLFWAIQFERSEMVKLLLEHHADPNAVRSSASISAQPAYEKLHPPPGHHYPFGSPNTFTGNDDSHQPWAVFPPVVGETPLMFAATERAMDRHGMVSYQIIGRNDLGASEDANEGRGAKAIQLLLDHGANPNLVDPDGWTALIYAIAVQKPDAIRALIDHGADVNILDKQGRPPLAHLAGDDGRQMEEMLIKAGADADYNRRRGIWTCGLGGTPKTELFECPTNSINHYTLVEFLATLYRTKLGRNLGGNLGHVADYVHPGDLVPFPDFARVEIHRLNGKRAENLRVNAEEILRSGDGSRDIALRAGDMVEIPEQEHKVADKWASLSYSNVLALERCLLRTVQRAAQGQTVDLALLPPLGAISSLPIECLQPDLATNWLGDALKGRKADTVVRSFLLNDVVRDANVLLNTWDLTHVRLTRGTVKMTFNLTSNPPPNVWLEDGDVIEIPELGESAPVTETK